MTHARWEDGKSQMSKAQMPAAASLGDAPPTVALWAPWRPSCALCWQPRALALCGQHLRFANLRFALCVVIPLFAMLAGGALVQAQDEQPIHHWAQKNIVDEIPFPPTPFLDDLTPGYVVVEGDIQIPLEDYLARTLGLDGTWGGTGITLWGSTVPYDFVTSGGGAVNATNQQRAIDAMNVISGFAGINFVPATGSQDRIRFQNSNFNNSPIGRRGGAQIINIVSWTNQVIIIHEIYHSLGFWHEQSRGDRNTYVTIQTNNICGSGISNACTAGTGTGQCCWCVNSSGNCISCAFNFDIVSSANYWGPYDFGSMMHYGATAFSCNTLATITVNSPWTGTPIGQRTEVSYWDQVTLRANYPYAGDRWVDRTVFLSGTGSFGFPYQTFSTAVSGTPTGGKVYFKTTGSYSGAVGHWTKAMRFESPRGTVILGN
jgi:hypothetical protein